MTRPPNASPHLRPDWNGTALRMSDKRSRRFRSSSRLKASLVSAARIAASIFRRDTATSKSSSSDAGWTQATYRFSAPSEAW